MGKSYTPAFRIEVDDVRRPDGSGYIHSTGAAWRREYGRPTSKNLGEYMRRLNDSLKPGGVNAHISRSYGFMPFHSSARIVRQSTGETVAAWEAPLFSVV